MQLTNFAISVQNLLLSLNNKYHKSYKEFWNYLKFNIYFHWHRCMEIFDVENRNVRNLSAAVENQGAETQ